MSDEFKKALKITLELEGMLSDHPTDKGGLTYKGITQKTYDIFRLSEGKLLQPVYLATDDEISQIYWEHYWLLGNCDKLEWPICVAHFDSCVHHGPDTACKILQTAIDVKVDGIIGPKTLAELDKRGIWETCLVQVSVRRGYMLGIVEFRKSQKTFFKGWLNRIERLCAALLGSSS